MSPLAPRIRDIIAASGPMSVADYMALCLFDPAHGYYTSREPFGRGGDFVTAPEISQMFGELVAVWLHAAWDAAGRPEPFVLAEIGPGRGTLMKDMLRTFARLDPDFAGKARFAMVEASERLAGVQRVTLAGAPALPIWCRTVDALPPGALFIVGNELFDALPVRQFVRTASGWRERCVGLDAQERLCFVAGAGAIDAALLPRGAETAAEGSIAEIAPARSALMDTIAARFASSGGAGLFIDYGYETPAFGDTLQAVRGHRYADVLADPGQADLTSHVDFAALAAAARAHGLSPQLATQGDFLLRMGLLERAGRLGASADAATRARLSSEVERLAGPNAMGTLFKVLAVQPGTAVPPGFGGSD